MYTGKSLISGVKVLYVIYKPWLLGVHIRYIRIKTALYIACTISLSIMGFSFKVLAYFECLKISICMIKD